MDSRKKNISDSAYSAISSPAAARLASRSFMSFNPRHSNLCRHLSLSRITGISGIFFCSALSAQDYSLDAAYGDISLSAGFNPDPYRIDITAGGSQDASSLANGCIGNIADAPDLQLDFEAGTLPLYVSAASADDTTLVINTPSGKWVCDDDSAGSLNPSLVFEDAPSGVYDIWLGTYGDEFSDATLFISELSDSSEFELDTYNPDISFNQDYPGELTEGRLESGDATRDTGAWQDVYSFTGVEGESAVIDVRSSDIDTFLIVHTPAGNKLVNDDYDGSTSRSLITLDLEQSGEYSVLVSSYNSGEAGTYTLGIDSSVESAGDERFSGSLASNDSTRSNGQFMDTYEFSGSPGRQVNIDLRSDDFDTFVILESPSGEVLENDDMDRIGHSAITTELTESGTYYVYVSSYSGGETGNYNLSIDEGNISNTSNTQGSRDTAELILGQDHSAGLQNGDALGGQNQYQDFYSFSGLAGDSIRIEMNSSDFDTFLTLQMPGGQTLDNDDYEGSTSRSVIELRLPEDGRYSIIASSYREGETGSYQIAARPGTGTLVAGSGMYGSQVYGIFVGISDYSELRETAPGWGDLSFTAEDATVARDALMNSAGMSPSDAITLVDREATIENVQAAFAEMSRKVGPDDTFVFFYSGHGGQELRSGGFTASDADGYDETLALSNGTMTDDTVTALFDAINANTSLIILDSCFSGGFAKDVVSRPGRMGLFSSDEDVPSLVASKFRAGGYLSHFFREAIEGGNADVDSDSAINAMELSQYIHMRYNAESLNKGPSNFNTPDFGYQHLVADRGGVSHDAILFTVR